ncbi:GTP-binding protein [Aquabacter sp. CN5-332]
MMRNPATLFGAGPFGRRLSRPGAGRIPVTVVTGFLGSGKTTLVRAALAHPGAARTAVIVNEFGEAGIDDVLLRTSTEQVALIGNGCICCAAKNDLHRALRNLAAERETGAVPPFERVLVETSGVSEPGQILQSFANDRTVSSHYALEGLVTVVDAALAAQTQDTAETWTEQVVLADRLVLSKTDMVSPEIASEVTARLAALNPEAPLAHAAEVRRDPAFLFGGATRERSAFLCAPRPAGASAGYETFTLTFDAPFDWPVFSRVMDALTMLRGDDLLRVKGFVNVTGCAGPVVVHYVQHLAAQPEELTLWPTEDRRTRLVFITRGLGRDVVEALFSAFLGLVGAAPHPSRTAGERDVG